LLQEAVIIGFGSDDVAAEVEHRDVKQSLLDEVQHIDDATGAAIAIIERVDALELVVNQRHLDEWIGIEYSIVIDEPLQIPHESDDDIRFLGGVYTVLPAPSLRAVPGSLRKPAVFPFQFRLYLQHMVRRQEATIPHQIESDAKRLPVAQDLFRAALLKLRAVHRP